MRKVLKYILLFVLLSGLFTVKNTVNINAQNNNAVLNSDTTKQTSRFPILNNKTNNNPFLNPSQASAIELDDLDNFKYKSKLDVKTRLVHFYKKIGNMDMKMPYTMTLEDYMNEDLRNSMLKYWEERSLSANGTSKKFSILDPTAKLGVDGLDNLFGSNLINIKPQGRAELRIGINTTDIDNPTLQENLRKTTTFDFEEKIQMNIQGKIGDKLNLGINYNTEATFEFENEVNLEYEGKEDDILKSVEAGNVSLTLPGTLITGSQSLFGVKTEMQFGKLSVSTVLSQQKGETSVMDIQGGAQTQEFEVPVNEYDKNRHFFLSNYFRDLYNDAQKNYPILSKISIKKVEVWITNRAGNFDNSRNIIGFMDIGETGKNVYNPGLWNGSAYRNPDNEANSLFNDMNTKYSAVRDINTVTSTFEALKANNFIGGQDFEKIENARLLNESEFTLNSRLGFISLNSSLNADEVLAVAFEYDYNGQTYTVGEFTNSGGEASSTLFLKLIKSTNLTPTVKQTWDLMMKNIYAIGAYQVNREDFVFDIAYVDDSTGAFINYFPDEHPLKGELLLRIMDLDKLNEVNDPTPDGTFDYIEDQTIYPQNGRIIFPVLEPFGSHLKDKLNNQNLESKYVYQALYDSTQTLATQEAEKNKFWLRGSYKSSVSNEISLNAQNIPQGSVIVTAGGLRLQENVDYTVDYSFGTVKIINPGLLSSGTPIQVSLESQSLFNLQTKTLIGTHLNYQFSDDFNIGATVEYLREQPLTQKVNIGDEPIANTIYGFNTSYYTESQWLTNTLDKLPLLQLKEPSSITFEGEFAQLLPGHPNVIQDEGQSYIDDFEGTETSIDMRNWTAWSLSSAPKGQDAMIPNSDKINDLSYGYNRAKIAWYTIDPLFFRTNQFTPNHIKNDKEERSNHYVRQIYEQEIWPEKEAGYGEPTNISVLNVAYYPDERGPYNFSTDLDSEGNLNNPGKNWGGIQRRVETSDFEAANVEFIEFWMMDPFIYNSSPGKSGSLYFNLGNVSEDVLNDSRKFFEQGMPGPDEAFDVDSTVWGYIPTKQSLVDAFSNDSETRIRQDVGLDGLTSIQEQNFFKSYIDTIRGSLSDEAYNAIVNDPAADNYHYYRGSDFDRDETSILDRYKNFNGPEGNSVPSEFSPENYPTASISIPNQEDINEDNTLSENESYFQYRVELDPSNMVIGKNYITDIKEADPELPNGNKETIKWYQFRIPVNQPNQTIGNISDLRSIRFMRMFLHGFQDTTILRFASLDLVRSEWRKYTNSLVEKGEFTTPNDDTRFITGSVNIEENAERQPINYVLPPGIDRVIDPANPQVRQLNEQSISLKVTDLPKNERRAIFKTLNMDMRQYGRLKMEVHAEKVNEVDIIDNKVMAFIRLGSDSKDNYYEYEVPLEMTKHGAILPKDIWPESNRIDFALSTLQEVKLERNRSNAPTNDVYIKRLENGKRVKIKGNPNLGNVRNIMIGVRSTVGDFDASFETWFNELRLTDFNEKGGWAANARTNVKLSDLGSISMAGSTSSSGFGSIDQSVMDRSQEDFYQYDFATNLELGKLLGAKSRLSVPFYYSHSKEVVKPEYYPLDPDIPLDVALDAANSKAEEDSIKNLAEDVVDRKSINFTNVRLKPKSGKKSKIYDVSNLSATYAYNETTAKDINTEKAIDKDFKAVLAYNFNNKPKNYQPFKSTKILKGKVFKIIKDFNFYLMPTQLSFKTEMLRNYSQIQLRNVNNPNYRIPVTVRKDFNWNRYFDVRFNFTKQLKFDFSSATNARIDEPDGIVTRDSMDQYQMWKDSVLTNILSGGRTTNYQHSFNVNYTLPINKLPLLDWTNSSIRYQGAYYWMAAPVSTNETTEWGNTIRNNNNIQGSTQFNFNTLYNKSKYLKGLKRKYNSRNKKKSTKRTVRYNKNGIDLQKGQPYIINHKLKTENVRVRMFDSNGRTARGKTVPINDSKSEFIPEADYKNARAMVTGTVEDKSTILGTILDYTAMVATGVKNISITYNESNGTILPGYLPDSKFLGTSSYNGLSAPGYSFILGMQDRNFAQKAAEKGWITADTINQSFIMTHQEDLSLKATIQPINGLRIDLNANRRYSRNLDEYYFKDNGTFAAFNTRYNGNFSMTYNLIKTSFNKVDRKGIFESETYQQFLQNRNHIANRLINERKLIDPGYNSNNNPVLNDNRSGYNLNSPDVLVPAFLSAYSGTDPDNIFTNLFPNLLSMQPNWRLTYNGLSKIKFLSKYIRSFDITHSYRSLYNVGSYVSNSEYSEEDGGISWIRNAQDLFVTQYQVNSVTLDESFSPLIGFNINWKNSLTTRFEIKNKRTLNLSLTNNQVIENYYDEFVIGLGYRFDKMNMILGSGKGQKKMSSDLNLRMDLSVRDNISLIRKIEDGVSQLTSGQKITTLKFTADYVLSDRFNMQVFYDRAVNKPYISLSYPTTTSNFGVSFSFSLTQ